MTGSAGKQNASASVRARLLKLARSSGQDFQALTIRYTVERFLARLARSPHRDRFVLKGAMLYVAWKLKGVRPTMDLDLLGIGKSNAERLISTIRSVCKVPIPDDGLDFEPDSITASAIREESIYDGVRIVVRVYLGQMPIRLQIDVGFGDIVTPAAQLSEFPALLDGQGPSVRVYSPETVIAEKLNAMVQLGMANSRMKDYFDIWMLSQRFTFDGATLRKAIVHTFARRQTELPDGEPVGLRDEFAHNELKQRQWNGFVKRLRQSDAAPALHEVVCIVRALLLPIALKTTKPAAEAKRWSAEQGWHSTQ